MMMHSETFRPSWQQFPDFMDSLFDEFEQRRCSDEIFSQFHYKIPNDFDFDVDPLRFDYPIDDFLMDFDGFESVDSIASPPLSSSSPQWSPLSSSSVKSDESSVTEASLASQGSVMLSLPAEDMEMDTQLSLHHLMKAYGEAMEGGQADLMEAISRCAVEKADPLGGPRERLAFNFFRHAEGGEGGDGEYIGQECRWNTDAAFQAFYQAFPFGRFAHFAANSAILRSAPRGEVVRVVDFDLGEGVQWAPVIEAMAALGGAALRLTSIKWDDDDEEDKDHELSGRRFRDTSGRLGRYAGELGVELKVEEMNVDDLMNEAKDGKWIAFNCMVGLPHMGMRKSRSRNLVHKFLTVAHEIIAVNNRGIVTFAEEDAFRNLESCADFGEYFDRCSGHYQTILDCMEMEFPRHLSEARLAMEALFVSPSINPASWGRIWEEVRACGSFPEGIRVRVSGESLAEARELVGGKSWYGVGIGERENEMVLQWRGTPLVKFSSWGR